MTADECFLGIRVRVDRCDRKWVLLEIHKG